MAQNNLCYNLPMSKHKDLRGLVNYEGDEGLVAMACRLLEHAVKEYKDGSPAEVEAAYEFFTNENSLFYFWCNVANMRGGTFDPYTIREALGII